MSLFATFSKEIAAVTLVLGICAAPLSAEISAGIGTAPAGGVQPGGAAPVQPGTAQPVQPGAVAPAPGAGGPPPLATQPPPLNQPPAVPTIKPYFVAVNGQAAGPFDEATLRQMIARGELKRDTLVWAEGMADWTPADKVDELAPLLAAVPPEVKFNPTAFLTGNWRGDPVPTRIPGFTSAQVEGTATYTADGRLIIYGKLVGVSVQGMRISMTISGDGTYKAEMQGEKRIIVTPTVALNYTSDNGGPGAVDSMTAPFVVNIIDDNTVTDDQGYRSYRLR